MSVIGSNILAGASGQAGYFLTKSLRFRNSASAYLNRTGGTSTSRRIHTFSFWTKSSVIGGTRTVVSAGPDDNNREVIFIDSNKFTYQVKIASTFYDLETTQVFRDPAAWYHFVVAVDTTQATGSNRVKIYVNGSQITAFGTAVYPPQNADLFFDDSNGSVSYIGALRGYLGSFNYDGYFAEFNFIDGQALTPSSFGETSTTTGVWIPKKYTGTYGTNGFYLPFTDTTSTSTLGTDFSGNSNTWTVNNISLTSGSTYDSMNDVPTLTSATTANYCVLNPLKNTASISNANLQTVNSASAGYYTSYATMSMDFGKYYWEVSVVDDGVNSRYLGIGVADPSIALTGSTNSAFTGTQAGNARGWTQTVRSAVSVAGTGLYNNGSTVNSTTRATTSGTRVFMVAYDANTGKCWMGYEGTWWSGDPAAGTSEYFTATAPMTPVFNPYNDGSIGTFVVSANFGQRPFSYTPPTGFVALNTFNLPTPTIGATASSQANEYFDVTTYTGNGTAGRVITMSNMTNVGFAWVKIRSGADDHRLANTVTGGNKHLKSNATDAESTSTNMIQAFSSNTFTIGSDTGVNANGSTYVGWVWANDGTSGSSNTAGSITSTVSANTTAGFSIVTYTGTGSNATVGHGLGVAPSMIIIKNRSTVTDWPVYHGSNTTSPATQRVLLNTTDATATSSTYWNNTAPTSSVFSISTYSGVNGNTNAMVAYCFAPIAGYSAFGSYTGNGSTDGTFIFTGFRPRYVMIKASSTGGAGYDWFIHDTARDTYNACTKDLEANLSLSEDQYGAEQDFLSNGFKLRNTGGGTNQNGVTYIYMAFCESPFKYANAR